MYIHIYIDNVIFYIRDGAFFSQFPTLVLISPLSLSLLFFVVTSKINIKYLYMDNNTVYEGRVENNSLLI